MQAILFDLDGTLINSLGDICGILNRVRQEYGWPSSSESELRPYIGHGLEHLVERGVPEANARQVPEIMERYRRYYLENPEVGGGLYPGVEATLRYLRSLNGLKLGVATNKLTAVAVKTVAHYLPGIPFDIIVGPDAVSRNKPAAEHLLEPLAALNVSPSHACFLGDHEVDKQSAESAGVRFFGARYGFGGVDVPDEQALDSFPEILKKLRLGLHSA